MSRRTDLAKIHIAKKQLKMDDDSYRAMLKNVVSVESTKDLDFHGRQKVLHKLKQLGFSSRKKYGVKSSKKPSISDKIRAVWIEMAQQEIVWDSSETALQNYVKRMTKNKYQAPQFCDTRTAIIILESLKKWQKRVLQERNLKDLKDLTQV